MTTPKTAEQINAQLVGEIGNDSFENRLFSDSPVKAEHIVKAHHRATALRLLVEKWRERAKHTREHYGSGSLTALILTECAKELEGALK